MKNTKLLRLLAALAAARRKEPHHVGVVRGARMRARKSAGDFQ